MELFVERCDCGMERRPGDNWCERCFQRFSPLTVGTVSGRPPQLAHPGTTSGQWSVGPAARLALTIALALLLLRGWWGVAMHWGSPRMVLDVVWVPAVSAMAGLWLRDVWAREPLDR